jgi:hypothetical protein
MSLAITATCTMRTSYTMYYLPDGNRLAFCACLALGTSDRKEAIRQAAELAPDGAIAFKLFDLESTTLDAPDNLALDVSDPDNFSPHYFFGVQILDIAETIDKLCIQRRFGPPYQELVQIRAYQGWSHAARCADGSLIQFSPGVDQLYITS